MFSIVIQFKLKIFFLGGCYNGQVCWWDGRKGGKPEVSPFCSTKQFDSFEMYFALQGVYLIMCFMIWLKFSHFLKYLRL